MTLYRYDDGDDGSSDSWGESPEAYMRRKWLEKHKYLVPVTIDRSRVFAAIQRIEMQPGLTEEQCVDLILAAVGEETP